MSDGISLLPQPAPGWEWATQEVLVGSQVFTAMIQKRLPEPPHWWEQVYSDPEYSHMLTALTFLMIGAKKIRDAWKGRTA